MLAFGERYDAETLRRWMGVFVRRFFAFQFKRSCTADSPKVLTVALSPRGIGECHRTLKRLNGSKTSLIGSSMNPFHLAFPVDDLEVLEDSTLKVLAAGGKRRIVG